MFQKFEIGRLCFLVLFEIERIPTAIFLARKLGSRGNIGQDPLFVFPETLLSRFIFLHSFTFFVAFVFSKNSSLLLGLPGKCDFTYHGCPVTP